MPAPQVATTEENQASTIKRTRRTRANKVETEVVVQAPETTQETTEPVVEETQLDDNTEFNTECMEMTVSDSITHIEICLNETIKTLKVLSQSLKLVKQQYQKEKRSYRKKGKNTNVSSKARGEFGFLKPVNVSPALEKFAGLSNGQLFTRPKTVSVISKYIKKHNLSEESNKSIFRVDKVLGELLGPAVHLINTKKPELGVGYSYRNIQKYIKQHF